MRGGPGRPRYRGSFTAALVLAGVPAAAGLVRTLLLRGEAGSSPGLRPLDLYTAAFVLFLAAAAIPVPLRVLGARAAFRVTDAACWILLFWFPFGTGLFAWWILRERDLEEAPGSS